VGHHRLLARLPLEQVDGVAGVVPQQVVGPRPRLAGRVHVGAAEEVGLDVHLLDVQLAGLDAAVDPLVAGVEAAHVAGHGDHAGLLLEADQPLGVGRRVGDGDLDQHVFPRAHALLGLFGVDLGRAGDDDGLEAGLLQGLAEVGRPVRDVPLLGELLRAGRPAAGQRDDLDSGNVLQSLHVAGAERTTPGKSDLHVTHMMPNARAACARRIRRRGRRRAAGLAAAAAAAGRAASFRADAGRPR
jgi:hypothetical protein